MKTAEQLLEEQNALLREQNRMLEQIKLEGAAANYRAMLKASAQRWDRANPIGKYFFINPVRGR